jgi:adenylate kinase
MKLVLITGLKEIDKKAIARLVLQRVGQNFKHIDIDSMVRIKTDLKDMDKIRSYISTSYKKIGKEIVKNLKNEANNIIITGSASLETIYGYYPLITKDFFKTFNPDLIILMEIDPSVLSKDEIEITRLKNQQIINRNYLILYSIVSGAFFRIVKIEKGNIMDSVEYISSILREI